MSSQILASRNDANIPLQLSVFKASGGVSGLTVVVAVRDARTINSYLDFDDDTFKTSGFGTRQKALTDIGGGFYVLSGGVDASAFTNLPAATDHLIAEYEVSGAVKAIATDVIVLREATIRDVHVTDLDKFESVAPKHSLLTALLKLVSRFNINTVTNKAEIFRTDGATLHATQDRTTDATLVATKELKEAV